MRLGFAPELRSLPSRSLPVAALAVLLVACGFESDITPIDWGETGEAPAFEPGSREQVVQEAIDAGDYQGAIELAIEHYGIDTSGVIGSVTYIPGLEGLAFTRSDGVVGIGDGFFTSPGLLASVIGHEMVHIDQIHNGRDYPDGQGDIMNEVEAYDWELDNAVANGLSQADLETAQEIRALYYDELTDENKALVDQGIYVLPIPALPPP
jgi:hypothetical protein